MLLMKQRLILTKGTNWEEWIPIWISAPGVDEDDDDDEFLLRLVNDLQINHTSKMFNLKQHKHYTFTQTDKN